MFERHFRGESHCCSGQREGELKDILAWAHVMWRWWCWTEAESHKDEQAYRSRARVRFWPCWGTAVSGTFLMRLNPAGMLKSGNSGKQSELEIHGREHFARNQKFLESAEHLVRVQVWGREVRLNRNRVVLIPSTQPHSCLRWGLKKYQRDKWIMRCSLYVC